MPVGSNVFRDGLPEQGFRGKPKERPPPSKPPTRESDRYLQYLENFGQGLTSAAICRALECNRGTPLRWRAEIIGFRDREKAIRAAHDAKKKDRTGKPDVVPSGRGAARGINTVGLTHEQVAYLKAFALLKHRIHACDAVPVGWREVKDWIKKSARFKEEFAELQDEIIVANEDSVGKKGATGDIAAARFYLQRNAAPGGGGGATPPAADLPPGSPAAAALGASWLAQFGQRVSEANLPPPPPEEPVEEPVAQLEVEGGD